MSKMRGYFRLWKFVLTFLTPLVFIQFGFSSDPKMRCAYVLGVMSLYWVLGLIPEAVTALIPIALFPVLGILSTSEACAPYMKSAVMMMIAGLMLAFAIEDCNLHKRIALRLLLCIGTGIKKILLGLMLGTMFLSFWISNTATTAMMLPVTEAIVTELSKRYEMNDVEKNAARPEHNKKRVKHKHTSSLGAQSNKIQMPDAAKSSKYHPTAISVPTVASTFDGRLTEQFKSSSRRTTKNKTEALEMSPETRTLRIAFFLSVAYSANIGGTGTITGTGPNLVLQGLMDEFYPIKNDLSFATWMMYAAPGAILIILIAWMFIQIYYLRKIESSKNHERQLKIYLEKRYSELGNISFHEIAVASCFVLILLLWFLRDPRFIPGWGSLFKGTKKLSDATPAILILVFMFAVPANFHQFRNYQPDKKKPIKYLLNWRSICKKMPWGVILLVGGGFSLAEGTMKSGLSNWFGEQLSRLNIHSPRVLMSFLTIFAAFLTEITSNSATAAVILPVINQAALNMRIHPLFFTFPVTIAVSFAFMLPVATPCNALVYDYLKMKTSEMIRPGFFMNLICIAIEILLINTLGQYIFNFSQFPDWAEHQAFLAVSKAPRLNVTVNLANALSPKMINVTG